MKKRILSILLCACMVLSLMPAIALTAWAADYPDGWPDDPSGLHNDDTVTIGGTAYIYKGDVSTSGLNISGKKQDGTPDPTYNAPTTATCYKAGSGYVLFTPAVTGGTSAKLTLNNAVINPASGRALFLPAESVDIIVTGDNALTATSGYSVAIDPSGEAVRITGSGNLSLTGPQCIVSWGTNTPSVTIDISGDLSIFSTASYSISASGNIALSAASIRTGIISAGSGSFTATATTGNLTIDKGTSLSTGVIAGNGITLAAPNGEISVTGNENKLLETGGTATLSAQGDITLKRTDTNDASPVIRFGTGISIISHAGSIDVTTSSGCNCMEETSSNGGTVTLNAAKDITLNAKNAAISASSQAVDITAGGKLSSTSAYGFQVGTLNIKANEVSVAGTQQSGIAASSVSITNPTGGNCKRVSIVATSGNDYWAAISSSGNVTVKAEDLFICGNGSAKAIKSNGIVTIGDAGLIIGAISTGTDRIAPGVARATQSSDSSGGLNLTTLPSETTVYTAGDGYLIFTPNSGGTSGVLRLHNATITGDLTLPADTTIKNTAASTIHGNVSGPSSSVTKLSFIGTAPLTINGGIYGQVEGDTVTVKDGAKLSIDGRIFLGGSGGRNGTLNIAGAGTSLNVISSGSTAVYLDMVNVGSGASLTVSSTDGRGVLALSGGVNVTGGSTLTANCDYGVYIIGGKLTVDSSSKLITNGTVAPFCVVDDTSLKSQNAVVSLPGIPAGTEIKSVKGADGTYWSLVNTGGSLSVADEKKEPVTLTGAVKGLLSFLGTTPPGGSSGGSGGSVSTVNYTLTFETNGGTKISDVTKENGTILDVASYNPTRQGYDFYGWYADKSLEEKVTSIKLTKNTTIYAKWMQKSQKLLNIFTDVSENAYYYDAVLWAVEQNIANGTGGTIFSPDMICTRAQEVTLLWRTMGSPQPTCANCPFTDVSKDAYYYKPVLWAIEKGITKGTSSTAFSPNDTVTRSQSMTFLWRAAGEATSASTNPFVDVSKDAYYYNAVLWAVEKNITKGTSSTAFSPNNGCTRAQIVTFIYRYMGK